MSRPPGEYLVLTCLGSSLAFCGYQAFTGTLRLEGGSLAATLVLAGLAIGALGFILIILRRKVGAVFSVVFYGLQILSVALPSGARWGFNSLPTLYFRIAGDRNFPINLNVVSLVLFCISVALWVSYQQKELAQAGAPPNNSLERTREG
jgi:hypothetical protein